MTHSEFEMAASDAARRHDDILARLVAWFDVRLEVLREPAAAGKVGKLFKARGRLRQRPKAGSSY